MEIKDIIRILDPLIGIYSPSGHEDEMSKYVTEFLLRHHFFVKQDKMGNVMAFRNSGYQAPSPMLCAHMDTQQKEKDEKWGYKVVYHPDRQCYQDLEIQFGADDKAGIAIILALAAHTKMNFRVVFTVQEEVGQKGIRAIPQSFLKKTTWCLVLDRAGASEVVISYDYLRMCPPGFADNIIEFAKPDLELRAANSDSYCDAPLIAKRGVSTVNMCAGYTGQHQPGDKIYVPDVLAITKVVERLLTKLEA